ncbi:hypothetical protein SALBM311S_02553 [Streptomyces alboniger]
MRHRRPRSGLLPGLGGRLRRTADALRRTVGSCGRPSHSCPSRRHWGGFRDRGRDSEEARPVHLSGGTPGPAAPPYRPCPSGAPHQAPNTPEAHRVQRKPPLHQPTPPSATDDDRPSLGTPTPTGKEGITQPSDELSCVTPGQVRRPQAEQPAEQECSPSGQDQRPSQWDRSGGRLSAPMGQEQFSRSNQPFRSAQSPSRGWPSAPTERAPAPTTGRRSLLSASQGHPAPALVPVPRRPPDLPPAHTAIVCVALHGLAISTEQGQLTGQGLEGFYRAGRRMLARCQVRVACREPIAVQGRSIAADRARFVGVLRASPGSGPDPDVVVERIRHADGTERITLHSAASRPLRLPVEVALGTDLADLGTVAGGRRALALWHGTGRGTRRRSDDAALGDPTRGGHAAHSRSNATPGTRPRGGHDPRPSAGCRTASAAELYGHGGDPALPRVARGSPPLGSFAAGDGGDCRPPSAVLPGCAPAWATERI